jgi:hypothetical protein
MKNLLGGFPNEEYPPELFKARRVEYLFNMKRTGLFCCAFFWELYTHYFTGMKWWRFYS